MRQSESKITTTHIVWMNWDFCYGLNKCCEVLKKMSMGNYFVGFERFSLKIMFFYNQNPVHVKEQILFE